MHKAHIKYEVLTVDTNSYERTSLMGQNNAAVLLLNHPSYCHWVGQ